MSKSILVSSRPKRACQILNGDVAVDIRKFEVAPGTKVYVYCTKDQKHLVASFHFVDGWKYKHYTDHTNYAKGCTANVGETINGKVVASFIVNGCEKLLYNPKLKCYIGSAYALMKSGLAADQFNTYGKGKTLYAWRISQLKIFDEPRELKSFLRKVKCRGNCGACPDCLYAYGFSVCCNRASIKKAPQGFCYTLETGPSKELLAAYEKLWQCLNS